MKRQCIAKILRIIICTFVIMVSSNSLTEAKALVTGETVILHRDMLAARTMDDFDLMNRFLAERNMEAVVRMMLDGRVVELSQGSKADVMEARWSCYRLYVASGNHSGMRVYVSDMFFEDY